MSQQEEVIKMNHQQIDLNDVDDPGMDNIADDFNEMGFEDSPEPMPQPPPENEARKQHLRNLINKAKSGRLSKYYGAINTSIEGASEEALEATWRDMKEAVSAAKGSALSVIGIQAILVMIEQVGKRADVPGAADNFAAVAMRDEALLETFDEFELEIMERSPNFLRIPVKVRMAIVLVRTYMINRAINLTGANSGAKIATGNLKARVGEL